VLTQLHFAACQPRQSTLCWKGRRITSADVNRCAGSPVGHFTAFSRDAEKASVRETNKGAANEQGQALSATAAMAISNGPVVRRETEDVVARLILNRPASRNSLSEELLTELVAALASLGRDTSVRAVVLAAEGPAFCSGHDLRELTARRADSDGGRSFFTRICRLCSTMMMSIVELPQPVIACVQGAAWAAGCQLVASCDLAVAAADATFATPGVNIGLFCSTPMVALSRNVAPKHAMEMLLTGDPVSAADACRIGLVNRVVPAGEELPEALRLARRIAAKSAHAIRVGKQAFHAQRAMGLADAYEHASRVMVDDLFAADAKEGIGAFLAKRPPQWDD
jgi:enoyl-CoA hydratase/carnithine racemase